MGGSDYDSDRRTSVRTCKGAKKMRMRVFLHGVEWRGGKWNLLLVRRGEVFFSSKKKKEMLDFSADGVLVGDKVWIFEKGSMARIFSVPSRRLSFS